MLSGLRQQRSNGFERYRRSTRAFTGRLEGGQILGLEVFEWRCLIPCAFSFKRILLIPQVETPKNSIFASQIRDQYPQLYAMVSRPQISTASMSVRLCFSAITWDISYSPLILYSSNDLIRELARNLRRIDAPHIAI